MKTLLVILVTLTLNGGCHLIFPFATLDPDSTVDGGSTDGEVVNDNNSVEASTDGWVTDSIKPKPDKGETDGPLQPDSLVPDAVQPDSLQPDSQPPDLGPVCNPKIWGEFLDCTMHAGCQTKHSYWLKWYWSGANQYVVTIDSYTSLYSNDIGTLTPPASGTLSAFPQQVQYNMCNKVLKYPATVTLKIEVTDTTKPSCSTSKLVVVSIF